jgi:hypothetical protein
VLVWYRKREEMTVLAAGFGVSRATAYRYRDEVVTALHAQAPDLHEALHRVAEQGWSHVIVDGKVFRTDRCAETVTSAKGTTINSWYSGKHHAFGGNVQAVMRPDGVPIWTSAVVPGHDHDLTAARAQHVLGALYWSASQLHLPALADSGYKGAGHGVLTPINQPRDGNVLGADNQTYNALHRATRHRRTRLRPAHHPLARLPAPHRQPIQDRPHHRRSARTHPIRKPAATPILLRSPQRAGEVFENLVRVRV